MFWSRYPPSKLRHPRILQSFGRPTGVVIYPKPVSIPPPEVVHQQSHIVPLPTVSKAMVLEWTGNTSERHLVDL